MKFFLVISGISFFISMVLMSTLEKPIYGTMFFILGMLFLICGFSLLENIQTKKIMKKFKHVNKTGIF